MEFKKCKKPKTNVSQCIQYSINSKLKKINNLECLCIKIIQQNCMLEYETSSSSLILSEGGGRSVLIITVE